MNLLLAVFVAATAIAAVPVGASGAPAKPCWQRVLADWTNGGLEAKYKAECYVQAISHLPTDMRLYSDADSDIRRAMLAAIRKGPTDRGKPSASTPSKAAAVAVAGNDRTLPLPVLFATTIALTLAAAAVAGRLRERRGTARHVKPLRD